jgi:hypothetical protein
VSLMSPNSVAEVAVKAAKDILRTNLPPSENLADDAGGPGDPKHRALPSRQARDRARQRHGSSIRASRHEPHRLGQQATPRHGQSALGPRSAGAQPNVGNPAKFADESMAEEAAGPLTVAQPLTSVLVLFL